MTEPAGNTIPNVEKSQEQEIRDVLAMIAPTWEVWESEDGLCIRRYLREGHHRHYVGVRFFDQDHDCWEYQDCECEVGDELGARLRRALGVNDWEAGDFDNSLC